MVDMYCILPLLASVGKYAGASDRSSRRCLVTLTQA